MGKLARYLLGVGILAGVVWASGSQLIEVWGVLRGVTALAFLGLMAVSLILVQISVVKWRVLLEILSGSISLKQGWMLYLMGYTVNLLLPSHVGGDIMRATIAGKGTESYTGAYAATFLERYTGLLAMFFLGSIAVITTSQPPLYRWVVLVTLVGIVLVTYITAKKNLPLGERLSKFHQALQLAMQDKQAMLKVIALSIIFHCFTVINIVTCAWAVGWYDIDIATLFVLMPFALIVSSLPITPGGIGVTEGVFYFVLTTLGLPNEVAIAVPLLLRAKTYLLALAGAACMLR